MKKCNDDCIPCCDFCIHCVHAYAEDGGGRCEPIACALHRDYEHQSIVEACGECDDFHCFRATPSNADRIRGMSDEELTDWIDSMLNEDGDDWDVPGCYSCINFGTHHSDPQNKGTSLYECADCPHEGSHENGLKHGVLQWLRQPAETEGKE